MGSDNPRRENSNGSIKLYVDGVLIESKTNATPGTAISNNSNLKIGKNSSSFIGIVDDLSIWNEVLTANELTALYNSGIPLATSSNSGDYTSLNNFDDDIAPNKNTFNPDTTVEERLRAMQEERTDKESQSSSRFTRI